MSARAKRVVRTKPKAVPQPEAQAPAGLGDLPESALRVIAAQLEQAASSTLWDKKDLLRCGRRLAPLPACLWRRAP